LIIFNTYSELFDSDIRTKINCNNAIILSQKYEKLMILGYKMKVI
jgi:hypothetical protein